jgi:hypothetical protein
MLTLSRMFTAAFTSPSRWYSHPLHGERRRYASWSRHEGDPTMMKLARTGRANAWTLMEGEEPPLAAHLVTPRRGYLHHGLYVGNGRIIHYPGLVAGFRRRAVEEVSLAEFARGRPIAVRTDSNLRFEREDVVRRARARLGENRYHILRNNCEHFCEWCLSGVNRSRQLESLLVRLGATAVAIVDAIATSCNSTQISRSAP